MSDERRDALIQLIRDLNTNELTEVESILGNWRRGKTISPAKAEAKKIGDESPHSKDWPHAPVHRISEHGTYIVTAGTFEKQHLFRGAEKLDLLESTLLTLASKLCWHLEAWAVFSNHYHFIVNSTAKSVDLKSLITKLHAESAIALNEMDDCPARQVWFNYWDTKLTFEKSYLARLHYVHQNPVRHGLVRAANQYRWCSAAWFERTASRAQVSTIYSFKIDKVSVVDDFEPL